MNRKSVKEPPWDLEVDWVWRNVSREERGGAQGSSCGAFVDCSGLHRDVESKKNTDLGKEGDFRRGYTDLDVPAGQVLEDFPIGCGILEIRRSWDITHLSIKQV